MCALPSEKERRAELEREGLIERWHNNEFPDKELHEALGMTLEEYKRWLEGKEETP